MNWSSFIENTQNSESQSAFDLQFITNTANYREIVYVEMYIHEHDKNISQLSELKSFLSQTACVSHMLV